jgi:uncharacterized protein YcgL (UPF0745 family)
MNSILNLQNNSPKSIMYLYVGKAKDFKPVTKQSIKLMLNSYYGININLTHVKEVINVIDGNL